MTASRICFGEKLQVMAAFKNKSMSLKIRKIDKSIAKALLIIMLAFTSFHVSAQIKMPITEIVNSMSLEQKVQMVIGTGMFFNLPDSIKKLLPPMFNQPESEDTLYMQMVNKTRTYLPGAAGTTAEFPHLGITSQVLADGPAGLRIAPRRKGEDQTFFCTAFPIATLLASSWDINLVNNIGKAMGEEVLEYGADIILGPAMNLQRDPLCGRNFEYFSEDPLLTGKMAAAMVKGIQSNGVGTSIKHFAVNNQETSRMSANVIVSERALRELYLRGFEIGIKEGKPWTVMSSYNKINGVFASESHDLLSKILRDDWGFEGYVVTDWGGGSDVVAQMVAGNDLIMPGQQNQIKTIIEAVGNGKLDESILDKNIIRILKVMKKSPRFKGYKYSSAPDLKTHASINRQAASEGMILLKNDNKTLPLKSDIKKVAAFGNASYEFISGGTGSGDVNEEYIISLIEGLNSYGYETDINLKETYETYINETRLKSGKPKNFLAALMGAKEPVVEMSVSANIASKMAEISDIALITIGRNSGEGGDRQAIEGDFYLDSFEKGMIKTITNAFHKKGKKTIVILNIGGVIETESWRDIPDAILCAWQPGQEAGNSIVDLLSGKVNPSGKLPVSFPLSYTDTPSHENFPGNDIKQAGPSDKSADLSGVSFMQRVPWEVRYEEDIYIGYRYYNTFDVPVSFEFGYGLSYTTFEYRNISLSSKKFDKSITVSIDIKNTGKVAGREVVQVYVSAPIGNLNKPSEELVAFGKTGLLKPEEEETLSFIVKPKDIASFNETISTWIAEAGNYTIKIGASSKDIKGKCSFNIAKSIKVGRVSKALEPTKDFEKLNAE
jgi:beta-glucosidase